MQCLQSALHQVSDLLLFRCLSRIDLAYLLKVTELGTRWNSLMNFFNDTLVNKLLHLGSRQLEFTCCGEVLVLVHILIESWRSIVSFRTFLYVDIKSIEDGVFQSWVRTVSSATYRSRWMCVSNRTLVIIWLLITTWFLLVKMLTCLLGHRSDNALLGHMCDALSSVEVQICLTYHPTAAAIISIHVLVVLWLSCAATVMFKFRLEVLKMTLFGWFTNTLRFQRLLLLSTILLSELISNLFLNWAYWGAESDLLSLVVAHLLLHLLAEALVDRWSLSYHVNSWGLLVWRGWILIDLVMAKVLLLLLNTTTITISLIANLYVLHLWPRVNQNCSLFTALQSVVNLTIFIYL